MRTPAPVLLLGLLLLSAPLAAADREVAEQIERIEKNAKDPMEQRQRETAVRRLGKIGTAEAAKALLPLLDDPFEHLRDHAASALIAAAKSETGAEVRAFLAQGGLSHRSPSVRRASVLALGAAGGPEATKALRDLAGREKDPAVLVALSETAQQADDAGAFAGVFPPLTAHSDGAASFAAAEAAARIDGESAAEALRGALRHKSALGRAGAVLGLMTIDALPPEALEAILSDKGHEPPCALAETLPLAPNSVPWPERGADILRRLLSAPDWRVRAAGVQGALRVWRNEIVDLLIERLGVEQGRLKDDLRQALETYTGKALGDDPDLWKSFWEGQAGDFKAGPRPPLDKAGRVPFRAGGADEAGGSAVFFNLPIRSQRLVFLFDLSGSMRNAAERDTSGTTKLALLRQEFARTLQKLPEAVSFDLVVHRYPSVFPPAPQTTRAFGRALPATKQNRAKALEWLEKQEAVGWGAFYEPLQALIAEGVDTVILLSDGCPSRGRYDRDFRLLAEFPKANRFGFLAVNTVLVGSTGTDREFMESFAALTGGLFRQAGGGE